MFQCTKRRADTFMLVDEGRVARDPETGAIAWLGGGPGSWADAAREHLAEYFEAGLIEDSGQMTRDGSVQRLTTAGRYLMRRWHEGAGESVVDTVADDPNLDVSTLRTPVGPYDEITYRATVGPDLVVAGGFVDLMRTEPNADYIGRPYQWSVLVARRVEGAAPQVLLDLPEPQAVELAAAILTAVR